MRDVQATMRDVQATMRDVHCTCYRRRLQPLKENIKHLKTRHFFPFILFLSALFAHLDPDPDPGGPDPDPQG